MKKKKLNIDLKAFASTIAVDIFGYEDLVTRNASKFASEYGLRFNVPQEQIQLKIALNPMLNCHLLIGGHWSKQLEVEKLTGFFTGMTVLKTDPICQKVENGISGFIIDYCNRWQFDAGEITFQIGVPGKQLQIKAYLNNKNVDQVAVKSIIKFLL